MAKFKCLGCCHCFVTAAALAGPREWLLASIAVRDTAPLPGHGVDAVKVRGQIMGFAGDLPAGAIGYPDPGVALTAALKRRPEKTVA